MSMSLAAQPFGTFGPRVEATAQQTPRPCPSRMLDDFRTLSRKAVLHQGSLVGLAMLHPDDTIDALATVSQELRTSNQ